MTFERRYIIMMVCSALFIGFFLTPMGENFFREFSGRNNGKSIFEKMDYYSRREFSGAKKDLTYVDLFKEDDVYARTEFFYKPRTSDPVLRSGLVLKIGESEELIIKDTYNTKPAYHLISGLDIERFRTELIDDLPFLFDIQITRLPFSKDHVVVKTIVDKELNFSKKKGLENRIKNFTQMDYISVIYTHRGQVVDRTIDESDPAVDRLYLNLNEVQSYYTRNQLDAILSNH